DDISLTALYAFFEHYWPHLAFILSLAIGGTAAVHAAMTKNEVRAAIGWVGIIILSPLLGPLFYLVAGINRIRHDQISEQRDKALHDFTSDADTAVTDGLMLAGQQFRSLGVLGNRISRFPLKAGNHISL